jgi:hypothetical protein
LGITTISSIEFDQDVDAAMSAAESGPVFISVVGQPAYVLLRHDTYRQLVGTSPSLHEVLVHPDSDSLEFDPPRMGSGIFSPVDLGDAP